MSIQKFIQKRISHLLVFLSTFSWYTKYITPILGHKDLSVLVKGSGVFFVFKVLGLPLALITSLLISRWFGAEAMGLFSLLGTVMSLVTTIGLVGLNFAIPRFVAEMRAKYSSNSSCCHDMVKKHEKMLYKTSIVILVFSGLVMTVSLFFLAPWIAHYFFSEPKLIFPLQIISFFIFPLMWGIFNESFLLAIKKFFYAEFINKFFREFCMFVIVFVCSFFFSSYYLPIWSWLISSLIAFVFTFFFLLRNGYVSFRVPLQPMFSLLKISSPMLFTGLASMIIVKTDILMLSTISGLETAGIYTVVFGFAALIRLPQMIIAPVVTPLISEKFYEKKFNSLQKILQFSTRLISFVSGTIFLLLLLLGHFLLTLYGGEFLIGLLGLFILALGLLFGAVTGSTSTYLNVTGRQHIPLYIVLFTCIFNIIGNYLLIPMYGITGSTLVTLLSLLLGNIFAVTYIYKYDNIKIYLH